MINKTVLINQKWKCTDSGGLERASERRRKMKFHPFGKNERATPKERSSIAMFHQFQQRRLQLSRRSHTKMLFINIRRYQFSIMITCHTARLAMSMPRAYNKPPLKRNKQLSESDIRTGPNFERT
jgi:hypothetical protein